MASNTGASSPGEELMICKTSAVAVCRSSDSARSARASVSSRVRWSSCLWRSAVEEPRPRAAICALRFLTFVVFWRRVFIWIPPPRKPCALGLAHRPTTRREEATYALHHKGGLLDHLVGAGEQSRGHFDAERLGGFQIDDQFVLGGRLHWQVGWLFALKDAIDVAGREPEVLHSIRSVGDQAAAGDEGAV